MILSVGTGMDDLAHRIARRHKGVSHREGSDGNPGADGETSTTCCTISTEGVERLLRYAGVRIDAGSVEFDTDGFGEVEIQFRATRSDGRPMSGVLVVYLRVDRDGGAVRASAEIGPLW